VSKIASLSGLVASNNETPTGLPFVQTKRQFAASMCMSTRTIVSWMSAGMPHLRPGPRKILVVTADALAWLRGRYQVQGRPSSYRPRMKRGGSAPADPAAVETTMAK